MNIYLKEDDISDFYRISDYNQEYFAMYPDFKPFATTENFNEFLMDVKNKRQGINNHGVKEIFYFAIENNKIVGHGSIRINPESDENYMIYGHIMYGVVPSKRKLGYGTEICRLLIEKAKKLGIEKIIITCNEDNVASKKIIMNNNGEFFESVIDIEGNQICRYIINNNKR